MLCHGVPFNMVDITTLKKRDFCLIFGYFRLNDSDCGHNKIIPKDIVSKCHSFYGDTNKYIVDVTKKFTENPNPFPYPPPPPIYYRDEFVVNGHMFYISTMYINPYGSYDLLLLINPLNKETDYKLYYEWFCDDIHQKREKGIIQHTQNVKYPAFAQITALDANKYLQQKLIFYFYFDILQINDVEMEIEYEKNKYNYNINYEWKIDNKLLNKFKNAQQNEMFYSDYFGFGNNVVEMFYLIFIPKSNPYHNSVQSKAKLILIVPDGVKSNEYECKIKDDVDIHNGDYYDIQPTAYQIGSYSVPTYYPPQNYDKISIYYHDKVYTFTFYINLKSIFESEGKNEDIKGENEDIRGGEFIVESEGDYDTGIMNDNDSDINEAMDNILNDMQPNEVSALQSVMDDNKGDDDDDVK
eukprot:239185_1